MLGYDHSEIIAEISFFISTVLNVSIEKNVI